MRAVNHLIPSSESSVPPTLLEVTNTTVIHEGIPATVYKGSRTSDDKTDHVVLKFAFGKCAEDLARLRSEHRFYQKLEVLQGHYIPKCHGLFQALDDSTACLVLEVCGEPLSDSFDEADMDLRCGTAWPSHWHSLNCMIRMDVADILMSIHEHGVQHNDVEPWNVVVKDRLPRIVNFEYAKDHDCGCTSIIYEGAYRPNQHEFGCTELYKYAYEACIWRPGMS